jgi:transglutaminase-like putative cysteine protease
VLENFTGKDWAPNPSDGFRLNTGDAPAAAGLDSSDQKGDSTTTVVPTSGSTVGERLPLTYPAVSVGGVPGEASDSFRWDLRGLTLARLDTSATVGRYTVQSAVVDTSAGRLRNASTTTPADDTDSLTVPRSLPAIIRSTAASWTAGATTPYAKALAIQNKLRNGVFSYDEQTPAAQGYDGDGVGVIAQFLKVKAGYCVHFASTMALMARLERIPSRIVVGYQPGTPAVVDGRSVFTVSSDDLHAWPELYFDRVGWVRFEPTPGRGALPAYAPLPSAGASAGASTAAPSARTSDAVPSAAPSAGAGASGGDGGAALAAFLRGAGLVALIAAILALPGLARLALRRRRLRGVAGPGGAGAAWQEVLLTSADLGVPAADGRSPRETEEVLRTAVAAELGARSALGRLRLAVERQAYGPTAQGADEADVGLVLRALGEGASRRQRIVAAVAPRSLLGRLGPVATGVRVVTTGERLPLLRRSPGRWS